MIAYNMNLDALLLIFALTSILGWIIEVVSGLFMREKRLTNPGFLNGPYLPLHGWGALLFYWIATFNLHPVSTIILLSVVATFIELITGLFFLHFFKIRIWDYSPNWMNYKGIISPLYAFCWAVLGAVFLFFIYPYLSLVTAFFFSIKYFPILLGIFYGVFILDIMLSYNRVFGDRKRNILKKRFNKRS
jgi:uncharacterized membrane protein